MFVELVCLKFAVVVERDEDGYHVASVPELPSCHTQAKTLDELTERIKEAIVAYLEAEGHRPREGVELVGLQFVEVSIDRRFACSWKSVVSKRLL
jgi:predicted RNase H-like HicB family nuclease